MWTRSIARRRKSSVQLTEHVGVVVTFREVTSPNFSIITGCTDYGARMYLSACPRERRDEVSAVKTVSLNILRISHSNGLHKVQVI